MRRARGSDGNPTEFQRAAVGSRAKRMERRGGGRWEGEDVSNERDEEEGEGEGRSGGHSLRSFSEKILPNSVPKQIVFTSEREA